MKARVIRWPLLSLQLEFIPPTPSDSAERSRRLPPAFRGDADRDSFEDGAQCLRFYA
jgi:hypothetical protein